MTTRSRIKRLIRCDESILRLGGCGSGFYMTWAADGNQFMSMADGTGFSKPPEKVFHSRILIVSGDPPTPLFGDLAHYPDLLITMNESASDSASFWGGACLAVDGRIYHHLTTPNRPWFGPDQTLMPDFYFVGSKLIYSSDNGLTWRNRDGSSPVVWEKWGARSRGNMVFFEEEPSGAFAWLAFLQMGRNYELNKDGYVYVYSPNGYADGTMNELVMFRTPKAQILDRRSYEFFAGIRSDGSATWTRDIAARSAAHTFPRGWVNKAVLGGTPIAWIPSVTYNAPLGVYMMASWGTGCNAQGGWFGKPSYLGIWVAPTPWGPFTQIHEELAWTPGNDEDARAFSPQIAPKWVSPDGKSFWLIWSDYQYHGPAGEVDNPDQNSLDEVKQATTDEADYPRAFLEVTEKRMPHYEFNAQRVDIVLS